jgi:hypothetical protein
MTAPGPALHQFSGVDDRGTICDPQRFTASPAGNVESTPDLEDDPGTQSL